MVSGTVYAAKIDWLLEAETLSAGHIQQRRWEGTPLHAAF